MSTRQRAQSALSTLTGTSVVIAVVGILLGLLISVAAGNSYGVQVLGYSLAVIGGSFIPISFVIGAISLHAQAVTPDPAAEPITPPKQN